MEKPQAAKGVPQSTLDSLTEQMKQLQLNQAQIINIISSLSNAGPATEAPNSSRGKRCFTCGVQDPPHLLHPSKCLEMLNLVREGLAKFDAQRGRFVMMSGSELPRAPYPGYPESPPHQTASVNHYGLFLDGESLLESGELGFSSLEFSSNSVLRTGKDTNVRFDPTGSAKREEKGKHQASEPRSKPTTNPTPLSSSIPPKPLSQPEAKIDIPVPTNPINRKEGWKELVPSSRSETKGDISMKDDAKVQNKYHFTSDLQEKSDVTAVFNALMNQTFTLPIYQLIGSSPQLQKLIADATWTRREYVNKQAEYYSLDPSSSSSDIEKDNIVSVTMTMVDREGEVNRYRLDDLKVGDPQSITDFLGCCANAILKSPEAMKLFAMVTGLIEVTINGEPFVAMIDTGSELNVGSIDLPEQTNCAVDFGGRNWSLKGIHGQPEPLQGVLVEAPMKIGGRDFPHHIFVSHQKIEKQDIILGQPFLIWYGTTTPPRARLTAEEEDDIDRDIELTRRLQNIGIELSGDPGSTRRTIITHHHRREAIRQLSDVLGPDITTDEGTQPDNEQRNNLTPLSTLTDLPFFGNTGTSGIRTESSIESSESSTPSTPIVEEDRPDETDMSGEQSSTPKRDHKPKTQEEMIISVATAVLEEKKKDKGVKVAAPEPFDGDRKETRRFLTEVEIYLHMHPTEYDTDEKKCLFFLSYLRGKDTQAWKQRNTDLIFDWKDGDKKLEWKDLKAAFKRHYLPIDIKADAQLRIEDMKMGERADNYVNEFRVLADELGYDEEALAHIF
uniref:Uncharacterized protein n=1 Tax=Moniliophthora roreri TaxID=221103 RepID=A0A0W0G5Z5_MONRR